MNASLNMKKWLLSAAMITCCVGWQSCLDDDDDYVAYSKILPNALVTVKPSDNGFYLQLDDSTTLLPVNVSTSPFGDKEVRALTNFDITEEPSGAYDKAVHINWIDSLLTKPMATNLGPEANDSVYGSDPVEIVNDWVTIAEDGYLTLRFRTIWSGQGEAHLVNLLTSQNPENPYEVEFRHDAFGDVNGRLADGLVAFKLDSLPDTNGQTVKLKLKWKSFSGDKSVDFDYCSRKSTPAETPANMKRGTMILK